MSGQGRAGFSCCRHSGTRHGFCPFTDEACVLLPRLIPIEPEEWMAPGVRQALLPGRQVRVRLHKVGNPRADA